MHPHTHSYTAVASAAIPVSAPCLRVRGDRARRSFHGFSSFQTRGKQGNGKDHMAQLRISGPVGFGLDACACAAIATQRMNQTFGCRVLKSAPPGSDFNHQSSLLISRGTHVTALLSNKKATPLEIVSFYTLAGRMSLFQPVSVGNS